MLWLWFFFGGVLQESLVTSSFVVFPADAPTSSCCKLTWWRGRRLAGNDGTRRRRFAEIQPANPESVLVGGGRSGGLLHRFSTSSVDDYSSSSSSLSQIPASLPIRLNKVFKATHSRREADKMIQDGRVTVNGKISLGDMVHPFIDTIALDGMIIQNWEAMNGIKATQTDKAVPTHTHQQVKSDTNTNSSTRTKTRKNLSPSQAVERSTANIDSSKLALSPSIPNHTFEYIKYYKPQGVICTTDQRIRENIIDSLTQRSGYSPKHRVYPVGRLDKDSTGLILITSDGRLPNASLRREQKQSKIYQVRVDQSLRAHHIQELRNGIVITTVAQRDGKSKPLTARTKPCTITSINSREVEIILQEGRNRQIRKMMGALGYEVIRLHRIGFGEISLDADMKAGDWKVLNTKEMDWINSIVEGDV